MVSALEVLAAQSEWWPSSTPATAHAAPAISHATLTYNRGRTEALADEKDRCAVRQPPVVANRRPVANCRSRRSSSVWSMVKRLPLARALRAAGDTTT